MKATAAAAAGGVATSAAAGMQGARSAARGVARTRRRWTVAAPSLGQGSAEERAATRVADAARRAECAEAVRLRGERRARSEAGAWLGVAACVLVLQTTATHRMVTALS